jgi:hypothetical protein
MTQPSGLVLSHHTTKVETIGLGVAWCDKGIKAYHVVLFPVLFNERQPSRPGIPLLLAHASIAVRHVLAGLVFF